MRVPTIALLAALALSPTAMAMAQTAPPAPARVLPAPIPLAITALPAANGAKLKVKSPAFKHGKPIPLANSAYGANTFPGLSWKGAPKATQSFAIIMQDSDPPAQFAAIQTILHWQMFNLPADVTTLAPGIEGPPDGAVNGANMRGAAGFYSGPRTPPGPPHHYHFQVFALDQPLAPQSGAPIADVMAAMKGHVLASGEVVGTYEVAAPQR